MTDATPPPLAVIFRDDALAVVDKPAGLMVHDSALARGETDFAADRLDVQERTVKAHLTAIFERLGVRNRTQAGVVLRELELSDPARQMEG